MCLLRWGVHPVLWLTPLRLCCSGSLRRVRQSTGRTLEYGVYAPMQGVRPNVLQGAQISITGTISTATKVSSAISIWDVAWVEGAGWRCSLTIYFVDFVFLVWRPHPSSLRSVTIPNALTYSLFPPPRTSILFEQPQISALSSDGEVYVFSIPIKKMLDEVIFVSHGDVV